MSSTTSSAWVAVATLLRPQGRKGELLAEPLTDLPELFAAGREVVLARTAVTPPPGSATRTLESHWFPTGKNAGRIVLQLSGCASITEAESLAGLQLLVPAHQLPTLAADTFFVGDLTGCTLLDTAAPNGPTPVGTIVDVEFATGPDGRTRLPDAAPLLALSLLHSPADADTVLIPFVQAWLDQVDIPNKRILMHLPPGLLEATEDLANPS